MAKKTTKQYEKMLRDMVVERVGKLEPFIEIAISAAAREWRNLEHLDDELSNADLTTIATGSMGQMKTEANPLIAHRDKASRTFLQWLEALGLSYSARPERMRESAKKGGEDDDDRMVQFFKGI